MFETGLYLTLHETNWPASKNVPTRDIRMHALPTMFNDIPHSRKNNFQSSEVDVRDICLFPGVLPRSWPSVQSPCGTQTNWSWSSQTPRPTRLSATPACRPGCQRRAAAAAAAVGRQSIKSRCAAGRGRETAARWPGDYSYRWENVLCTYAFRRPYLW